MLVAEARSRVARFDGRFDLSSSFAVLGGAAPVIAVIGDDEDQNVFEAYATPAADFAIPRPLDMSNPMGIVTCRRPGG